MIVSTEKIIGDKSNEKTKLKPFIRWAGGKQNLINEIFEILQFPIINRYFEPFLGGGSFYLNGDFQNSYLSDLNPNLINCYKHIKHSPNEVYNGLISVKTPITADFYYQTREVFNRDNGSDSLEQAVRFILLNKTSFNGIYRVNRSGKYNVPFGKAMPSLPTKELLTAISNKLQTAELSTGFYDEIEPKVERNDLVYFDPPYPKLSKTAFFNHYTLDKFDDQDQNNLCKFANRLWSIGANVVISNANINPIRQLYKNWNIQECSTYRYISCKKTKVKVKELIISNF